MLDFKVHGFLFVCFLQDTMILWLSQKSLGEGPNLKRGKWKKASSFHIQGVTAKQKIMPPEEFPYVYPNENKA